MTPNLFVATQTLFSPHRWFKSSPRSERPVRKTEHWDSPVPGLYEYIPGRGWYLVATDKYDPNDADDLPIVSEKTPFPSVKHSRPETIKMTQPVQVKYSKVLKRYLLAPDYAARKQHGKIQDSRGKWHEAGFFRLDDGIAWVECWNEEGEFIPGPYKLWCIDQGTGHFRHMLKGDDPEYIRSRTNSLEREPGARRRSQDSRSTRYRGSGPGSLRDGPSCPSTRANSIRAFTPSAPGSQVPSRRNSPKRTPSLPLEEAKAKLKIMAEEQRKADLERERERSRANSAESTRGRSIAKTLDAA